MLAVPQLVLETIMAIAMGGLIGIEREHTPERKYAGLRTLALLAGAGPGIVTVSQRSETPIILAIYLLLAVFLSVGVLVVRFYLEVEKLGFTTSVAVFFSAVLGIMVGYGLYSEATSLAILSALLLAEKDKMHGYVDKLTDKEISSALQLGALGFILVPTLPATAIDPYNAIVPRNVMLLALSVLMIEFLSYISMRQLDGSRGIYVTGLLGGVASSFATTGVMARLGRKGENLASASAGALLATFSMLLRDLGIASAVILPALGFGLGEVMVIYIPVLLMIFVVGLSAWLMAESPEHDIEMGIDSPFSVKSGLKFASIFVVASVASSAGQNFFGSAGVYATSFLGGLASSAAIVTSAATSFASGTLELPLTIGMIVSAIAGSIFSKIALIEVVNTDMRSHVTVTLLIALSAGAASFLFIGF